MAVFYDDFNRANGSIGSNYTNIFGSVVIESNALRPSTSFADNIVARTADNVPTTGNHFAKATLVTLPSDPAVADACLWVRGNGNNGFAGVVNNAGASNTGVWEVTSGGWTQRTNTTTSGHAGDVLRLLSTSGAVALYNDTDVGILTSYSSTAKNTNTRVGLGGWWNTTNTAQRWQWDNFIGGDGTNSLGVVQNYVEPWVTGGSSISTPVLDEEPIPGNLLISVLAARWGASGPVSTITPPSGFTPLTPAVIPNMEAHTAAIAYRIADGTEGPNYSVNWTTGSNISVGMVSIQEFFGIPSATPDKVTATGSSIFNVLSITAPITGTLGASTGLAFLVGLNRLAATTNSFSNDAGMAELFDGGATANSVAFNMVNAWQEFTSNLEYEVTISSGTASRMGVMLATFISDSGETPSGDATASFGFSSSITSNGIHTTSASSSWGFSGTATSGYPITDYAIEYRTTSGPGEWTSFSDSVTAVTGGTVTGLDPGVSYDFRVAAINSVGQGPWSNIATAISGETSEYSGDASASWGFSESIIKTTGRTNVGSASWGISSSATSYAIRSNTIAASFGFSASIAKETLRSTSITTSFGFAYGVSHNEVAVRSITTSFGFSTSTTSHGIHSDSALITFGTTVSVEETTIRSSDASTSWGFNSTASSGSAVSYDVVSQWGFDSSTSKTAVRSDSAASSWGFSETTTKSTSRSQNGSISSGFSTSSTAESEHNGDVLHSWGFNVNVSTASSSAGSGSSSWGFSESISKDTEREQTASLAFGFTANASGSASFEQSASVSWSFSESVSADTIRFEDVVTSWGHSASATTSIVYSDDATISWGFSSTSSEDTVREAVVTETWGISTSTDQTSIHERDVSFTWHFAAYATTSGTYSGTASKSWSFQASATGESIRESDVDVSWGFDETSIANIEVNGDVNVSWSTSIDTEFITVRDSSVISPWGYTSTTLSATERNSEDVEFSFGFSAWSYAGDTSLASRIFLGALMVQKIYVGQNQVIAGYLGSNKVF